MDSLTSNFIQITKKRIESEIVKKMKKYYGFSGTGIPKNFRPKLKPIERIVSYYDYYTCGLSVLAPLVANGDANAKKIVDQILKNMEYYRKHIYGHSVRDGKNIWDVPLRRLLFHAALAFEILEPFLTAKQKKDFRELLIQQTKVAIAHNDNFDPGEKNLYLGYANNHTAIFMQGVFHVGRVLGIKAWEELAREAALRFFKSGHSDGYWEENTNIRREGGPSMVYTPLTAGCLFDILNGQNLKQKAFLKAGKFYRSFLNFDGRLIPLADERTNCHERSAVYGLALHSLTPEGRGHIKNTISDLEWVNLSPEGFAVLYYELGLMKLGACAKPEYKKNVNSRISLPLGIVRHKGWTAGISALRALNRVRQPKSDYALDHQNMAYLSHEKFDIILSGYKSKNDPEFSTFRRGVDAYPIDTGKLKMGKNWAEVLLHYATFDAVLRWELGKNSRLIFETNDSREITTILPISKPKFAKSNTKFEVVKLKGFSPYSVGNVEEPLTAIKFVWTKRLVVEFSIDN